MERLQIGLRDAATVKSIDIKIQGIIDKNIIRISASGYNPIIIFVTMERSGQTFGTSRQQLLILQYDSA